MIFQRLCRQSAKINTFLLIAFEIFGKALMLPNNKWQLLGLRRYTSRQKMSINKMRKYFILLLSCIPLADQQTDAGSKMNYQMQQQMQQTQAIAQAAAMGVPLTIKPNTPPPPPEMESEGTEPEPSTYNDLFTYSGYFDPYQDDVHAFMINGKRRKRHRVNCGRDRKGRHCDFRRSHHQHGFYNRECIHYAGSLEIYGVWQCGSRQQLSKGAIVRMMVELHELILKYKQDKNDYLLERLERVMDYNRMVYRDMKKIFKDAARQSLTRIMEILEKTNEQVFENFRNVLDMSKDILENIKRQREEEIQELKDRLQTMLEEYPPPITVCDSLVGCEVCLGRDGCIWCTEELKCHQGTRRDGASFNTCDIWVSDGQCPEMPDHYLKAKQGHKDELGNYYQQADLELDQKLYIAEKQREMIQVKNQIDNRRALLDQMTNMYQQLRNRNIKMMDQYIAEHQYEGNFLDDVPEEDAEGGLAKLKKDAEENLKAEEEEKQQTKEFKKQQISEKKKAQEEFEKEQYQKRHEAIPIDKKKFKDKEKVEEILAKQKEEQQEGWFF